MVGEGKYNLDAVKEIKVTESFLGMDMKYKQCQIQESFEKCETRHYIDTVLHECGCLPLSISITKNVILRENVSII